MNPELLYTEKATAASYGVVGSAIVVGLGAACYTIKREE